MDADARAAKGEDMTDLAARLKNWRSVHLARLHLLMDEAADYVELLEAANAHSHSGFMLVASAVEGMSGEIKRLRVTGAEREAVDRARRAFRDMDHNAMTMQQLADYEALCGLLDRLRDTPATHATPSQGSVQSECTLTDAERAAVQWAAAMEPEPNGRWTKAQEKTWNKRAATLRGLLERME